MGCNIIRNEKGEINQVLTENGNNSLLYKKIRALGSNKEAALEKWALTYTATFKHWFGKGLVDKNGEPKIVFNHENQPVYIGEDNTSKHVLDNLGTFLSKKDPSPLLEIIKQRFNLVKTDGTVRNIPASVNVYNLQEIIEKQYPGVRAFILKDVGGDYISLDVNNCIYF